ncbi:MAG: AMP-binding protein, partial [Pseudomonadales bacterium]|nr:AMP-binding protein [Pseudomonadales bacterium]
MSFMNLVKDLRVLIAAARTKPPSSNLPGSMALLVEIQASENPEGIAILCEDNTITWRELNEQANRVASKLAADGIKKGDCVSLFMQNRISFVSSLLGIHKLGAIAGMINTNLGKQQLVHCINLIESKKCIFGEELTEALQGVNNELNLEDGKDYFFIRDKGELPPPNWAVEIDLNDDALSNQNHDISQTVTMGDVALFIFTSGTTGLPKAA